MKINEKNHKKGVASGKMSNLKSDKVDFYISSSDSLNSNDSNGEIKSNKINIQLNKKNVNDDASETTSNNSYKTFDDSSQSTQNEVVNKGNFDKETNHKNIIKKYFPEKYWSNSKNEINLETEHLESPLTLQSDEEKKIEDRIKLERFREKEYIYFFLNAEKSKYISSKLYDSALSILEATRNQNKNDKKLKNFGLKDLQIGSYFNGADLIDLNLEDTNNLDKKLIYLFKKLSFTKQRELNFILYFFYLVVLPLSNNVANKYNNYVIAILFGDKIFGWKKVDKNISYDTSEILLSRLISLNMIGELDFSFLIMDCFDYMKTIKSKKLFHFDSKLEDKKPFDDIVNKYENSAFEDDCKKFLFDTLNGIKSVEIRETIINKIMKKYFFDYLKDLFDKKLNKKIENMFSLRGIDYTITQISLINSLPSWERRVLKKSFKIKIEIGFSKEDKVMKNDINNYYILKQKIIIETLTGHNFSRKNIHNDPYYLFFSHFIDSIQCFFLEY